MSKDVRSSDSLRKALVRKVRDVYVNVYCLLNVGRWKRMLAVLERKLLAGSVVREKEQISRVFP